MVRDMCAKVSTRSLTPMGGVDALRKAGGRSGFPLQSLSDVHIYVPKHVAIDTGGLGWQTLTGPSTDVELQGAEKQVLLHPGPQAVILLSDQERVGLWSWIHGRRRMTLCTGAEVMRKERLSWCLGPTVRVSEAVMCIIVLDPNGRISRALTGKGEENGYEVASSLNVRTWSIKYPTSPVSTRAVETKLEGQPAIGILKDLEENTHAYPGRWKVTGPPLCSSELWVGAHQTPLKLVPLLAAIGTEPAVSIDAALQRRGVWSLHPWVQALPQDSQRREVSGEVDTGELEGGG